MEFRSRSCLWLFLLSVVAVPALADPLDIPPDQIADGQPAAMMRAYWLRHVDDATERWKVDYEKRKTPEEIAAYQRRIRERFLESLGGLPERTPLNPQVTGVVRREGYRVEKVIFESQPNHYVTGLLFLPDAGRHQPPYAGVLVPCGHAKTAKGHDGYQAMGALLALNGMAAFVFDPIDQGERSQYLGEGGWPALWGTRSHTMIGIGCILLGRNTARFEIWDGMRAIDYLQSRSEIDAHRIGCTGNSGGGTQTSYLMALDERIKAAAPSCYICGFPALLHTIGPQDAEQNIFGQVAFGMDHADYVMMRAPTPILLCTATEDFFDIGGAWDVFRYAKRLYTRMGYAERVGLLENDAKHNYNTLQREGVARWMARWLLGKEDAIEEPPIELLRESEYQCTPGGQVMEMQGARSTYDLNLVYAGELAKRRESIWRAGEPAEWTAKVRRIVGRPFAG
jgi:cephalosporin-C deacetylase-like acetyl esterase